MFSFSNIQAFDAPSMNHETWERELWGVNIQEKFPGKHAPGLPKKLTPLAPGLGNQLSVSIYPRSTPDVHVDWPPPDKGKCGDSFKKN